MFTAIYVHGTVRTLKSGSISTACIATRVEIQLTCGETVPVVGDTHYSRYTRLFRKSLDTPNAPHFPDRIQFSGGKNTYGFPYHPCDLHMHSNSGTLIDSSAAALTEERTKDFVVRRGKHVETLMKKRDPKNSGTIPVEVFSECLRISDTDEGGPGEAGEGQLSRADRKNLYRKWAVHGQVRISSMRVLLQRKGY